MEQPIFAAITGTQRWYGTSFIKPGQLIHLIKNPIHRYDHEAITAEMIPIGRIGYVAESPHTVPKGCSSAGAISDLFDHRMCSIVRFVVNDLVIVELAPSLNEVILINSAGELADRLRL